MLNNTQIKRLKSKEKAFKVLDFNGLYIEIKPNGRKFWRYRFKKLDGKDTSISLGEFPTVKIEDARIKRDERKASNQFQSAMFKDVAFDWLNFKNYSSIKNQKVEKGRIDRYLLPTLATKSIAEIKPKDILIILKAIEKVGHLETAKRVKSIISQIFRYAASNLLCDSDPTALLGNAIKKPVVTNYPAITDKNDFSVFLQKIDAVEKLMITVKYCLLIAPYVFLRSSEIRLAKPSDIDLKNKRWTVPGDTTKSKRDHIIPLCDSVICLLKSAMPFSSDKFLFPGARYGRPISENTLNLVFRGLGYDKNDVVFHGFRSSFSTLAREELEADDDLIERQLAHVQKNKVKAAYDRSYRIKERVILMNEWGAFIDGLKKTVL